MIEIGTIQLDYTPFRVIFFLKCNLVGFKTLDKIQFFFVLFRQLLGLMVKILNVFRMWFLIAQIKRFGTLNATQKNAALYKTPFLKKSRKTAKNLPFFNKTSIFDNF